MKTLLRDSQRYRFEGVKTVNSAIALRDDGTGRGRSMKCWVFERPTEAMLMLTCPDK